MLGIFLCFLLGAWAMANGRLAPRCEDYKLQGWRPNSAEIKLHPRISPAKVVDTFAFGFEYELEELLLRFCEMGPEVDEFHIFEGDHDFQGVPKPFRFQKVLDSGKLDEWKEKITYYKVQVPKGIVGYQLQRYERAEMKERMHNWTLYRPTDVLLEGDLDEIVSRRALQVLKNCATDSGEWKTSIEMGNFFYSMAWRWTKKKFHGLPTVAASFMEWQDRSLLQSVYKRPYILSARDGTLIGWHLARMLNGADGLAHKMWIMVEGHPPWMENFTTEVDLKNFFDSTFLKDPRQFDKTTAASNITKNELPKAVLERPDLFPTILRNVTLELLP